MRQFYVGQPVICVNDKISRLQRHMLITWPVAGNRYVVRDYVCDGEIPCLVLNEIRNRNVVYSGGLVREAGFWEGRFRPATDITELKKLLTTKDKEIEHA